MDIGALDALRTLVRAEQATPCAPPVAEMAATIAANHPGARAVIFYGSCLREARLDGLMLDFYVIVDDYRRAYGRRWLALANRLVPPNVFPFAIGALSAKYAVLDVSDLARETSMAARSVSVWARFAQPTRLVWQDGADAADLVADAMAQSCCTVFRRTLPMVDAHARGDAEAIWRHGFALTYSAELRAERAGRSADIITADAARYGQFGHATLAALADELLWTDGASARRSWRWLRWKGKGLTLLRLAKASFTFADGIDYLAWKINRHAKTQIVIGDWQRRHPIIAAISLLPRLLGQGAVK